ncbi:PH domain-containing protein [Bacillus safensis]|uniref:PH domain-containing protein n=1 Tax=Bacillus safensis TaxID=561879 RepID=UPI001BA9E2C3|nr:PH domain-containing protein [Bacillus safensis]MBR0641143.1 PH domain-containing protein [Bacillus safensis]
MESNSRLKRLHPLWMLFELLKSIKGFIFFCIFLSVLFGFSSISIFSKVGFLIVAVFVVYKIITILLEWKHFGYDLNEEELYLEKGRFITVKRHFPIKSIQGVHQNSTFFHRLFDLTSLLIDVGSSNNDHVVKLHMITTSEASRIKKHLTDKSSDNVLIKIDFEEPIEQNAQKLHYEIQMKEILIASLTSLRLLFFLLLIYSAYSEINQFFSLEKYIDRLVSFAMSSWLTIISSVFLLIILSILYGILKTYLQYGGFKLSSDMSRLYIEKGKLNITDFSIPKEKIEALYFTSSFIQKVLHIVKVKIISSTETDDENIKSPNILFPFINKNVANQLIPEVLPGIKLERNMDRIPWYSIIPKLFRSFMFWCLTPAALLFYRFDLWYVSIIICMAVLLTQLFSSLYSSYSCNEYYMQIKKGGLTDRLLITHKHNIERLIISETLLQKKLGLASIKIINRAKPTKTTVLHDLPKEMADKYYSWYSRGVIEQNSSNIPNNYKPDLFNLDKST